jgi:hypothetical protein
MSMFFDLMVQARVDAGLFVALLSDQDVASPLPPVEVLIAQQDPAGPIRFEESELSPRSKAIREGQLNHPVNGSINVTVHQSRIPEAEEVIVAALAKFIARCRGWASLIAHGEHLLFRIQPGSAVELFNAQYFWRGDRLSKIQAASTIPVVVENERKWLE